MKTRIIFQLTSCLIAILFQSNILAECTLPTSMPTNQVDLAAANLAIATCFAPTMHQMTDNTEENSVNGVADLITSIFFPCSQSRSSA